MATTIENLEIARQVLACHSFPEGAAAIEHAISVLSEKADAVPPTEREPGNLVQYMVRPVLRYFVTRWEDGRSPGAAWNTGSSFMGVFDSVSHANFIAHALAKYEGADEIALADVSGHLDGIESGLRGVCEAQMNHARRLAGEASGA
jgi:hypothetical protein